MNRYDLAVVGSGIGGSLISALNKDKNTILFEKDKNLGGCASTFKKYGNFYNTGATTFVGYEDNHILKNQFDSIGLTPNITKSEIAIRIIQKDKVLDRVKDFEQFLEQIDKIYPHPNNRVFWEKIKEIDDTFWKLKNIYFGRHGVYNYYKTSKFIAQLLYTFKFDLLKSANQFIEEILYDISKEYSDFIESQLLITIQSKSHNITLLSLALGLSYPFHDVFYVNGGMGSLIEDIVKDVELKRKEEIVSIKKDTNSWIVKTINDEYKTNKVVLNSSVYQSSKLFEDENIKSYYDSFEFSDQSAFVVYMTIDSKEEFLEHYQVLLDDDIPNCISNSFFISFSKKDDPKLSKNGYSVTISTHTKAIYWKYLNNLTYEQEKNRTQEYIVTKFLEYFDNISKDNIKRKFSATSKTFNNYINRYNCGGKAIGIKNVSQLPSCNTPFEGLYNVGDTVFAGQGWPGIAIGVEVLNKELNNG